MNQRKFGRTGLHLSELCFDTEAFGRINDETRSLDLLDAYYGEGGRFIQTVGNRETFPGEMTPNPPSEETVGKWLRSRGIPRDSLALATRIGFSRPAHGGGVALANSIRERCEQSLRRLQSRHLDLLVCEWNEAIVPVEDAVAAFDMLIRAGLVRYAVAAGFPAWRVSDSLHRSTLRNRCRFDGLQTEYSLLARERFESEALIMAREYRLGLLARSTLADGFSSTSRDPTLKVTVYDGDWRKERFGSLRGNTINATLAKVAELNGASPAQVALAWTLRDPQVTSALVSPSSIMELRDLNSSSMLILTQEEVAVLNGITPQRNSEWSDAPADQRGNFDPCDLCTN